MKIKAVKTFGVPPRWVFLKIETDEGLNGWGEPVLEGHAETLRSKVEEYSDFLVGQNPLAIEDIWQKLYRNGCYRGGPVLMSALSGIDMALWDIKGRYHDAPVYDLLGGPVRSKIRTYRWGGGDRPDNLLAAARMARAEGYSAMKLNACAELQIVDSYAKVDTIVRRLGDLRDGVGKELDLALDFHGRVHAPMAKILLKELEPLRPLFVEDPLTSQHVAAIGDLARQTSIPLAMGERLHSRYDFREVFEQRAVSIVNPDTAHVGGISEMKRIGNFAEAYDVALAPHCPLGPVALAACLQIDAICHNAFIQEQSIGIHYNQGADLLDYVNPERSFTQENGFLHIPTGPGLGIEVDEAVVIEKSKIGHRWRAPVWRHEDGSIAEW